MKTNQNLINALCVENGNGFPTTGDLVYDPSSNLMYEIVTTGLICTGRAPGLGSTQEITITESEEWPTEDEWDDVVSDTKLIIENENI